MCRGKRAKGADKENIKKVSGINESFVDTNKFVEATKFTTSKLKFGTAFINEFEPNSNHDSLSELRETDSYFNKLKQEEE